MKNKFLSFAENKILNFLGGFKSKQKIEVKDVSMMFDTRNTVSKKWFYPRYFSGQPHEPCISNLFMMK